VSASSRCIELDRDLAARLRQHAQLKVVESDVLKVDFTRWPTRSGAQAAGGRQSSYNISSPILFHLLEHVARSRTSTSCCKRKSWTAWCGAGDLGLRAALGDAAVALRDGERAVRAARILRAAAARRQRGGAHGSAAQPAAVDSGCWKNWCRWRSRSAASCCATRWASGWRRTLCGQLRPAAAREEVPVQQYLALCTEVTRNTAGF
jgi:hypothetical protein